jgi:hypothetical protein
LEKPRSGDAGPFFGVFENGTKITLQKPFKIDRFARPTIPIETYGFQELDKSHLRPA